MDPGAAMMTLRKLQVEVGDRRGARAAAAYPLDRADSPAAYAAGEADGTRAHAMWLGSELALAQLGVHRGHEVRVDELARALEGRHAGTEAEVRRPGSVPARGPDGEPRRIKVVNSFDLTFSAPKSVSLVWSQAGPELREAIEQAMIAAANAALDHVTRTRPVIGGKEPAEGFAASSALHVSARTAAGDQVPMPQLHVHSHLVGVLDASGNLRTPSSSALYRDCAMREAGAVGRAVLARELEALGFAIEARTGRGRRYFEIAGVPQALIERMSGRSRDVAGWVRDAEAATGGRLSTRVAAQAARATRGPKADVDAVAAQNVWDAHCRELEFGPDAIARLQAQGPSERNAVEVREAARAALLRQVWEEGPTVSRGALRAMAQELAPLGMTTAEITELLHEMQSRGELIALDEWQVTTHAIRSREEYVVRVASDAGRRRDAPLSPDAVDRGIAAAEAELHGHRLLEEQAHAVRTLSEGAGWMCLTGLAGTGKGPVLQAIAEAHRHEGWTVVAGAVDGATTQRLGRQVGAPAVTIQQLMHRVGAGRLTVDERTLIVIDEAGKVGLREWVGLAKLVDATGARMLAVGDIGQIGAIECPGILDVFLDAQDAIPAARLERVLRHRDPADRSRLHPWLGTYQETLYAGNTQDAIALLREHGALTVHADRTTAMVGMVDTWMARRTEHGIEARDAILIVHGSNDDVEQVNLLAQERRRQTGELGTESVASLDGVTSFHQHDVVMLRAGPYQPDAEHDSGPRPPRVENGTFGVVRHVDRERDQIWVDFEDPAGGTRLVMLDQRRLRAERDARDPGDQPVATLRLAYAGHPFPMQGATFDYVGSLWGHWSQRLQETYSGDTRARCWLDVHADRASLGHEGDNDAALERLAQRLASSAHRRASVTYALAPGVPIRGRAPADVDAAPRLPTHAPAVEPAETTRDPLEAFRDLLGDARLERIAARAEAVADDVAVLDGAALREARDAGRAALVHLHRPAALEVRRIEHSERTVAERIDAGQGAARRLEAEQDASRWLDRRRRQDLREAAAAYHDAVDKDRGVLDVLVERERELREAGVHPEDWLRDHGDAFARGIAAQRRLDRETGSAREAAGGPEIDVAYEAGPSVGE
jgi:conjugative relaxase-like TrwC/TraI family protein